MEQRIDAFVVQQMEKWDVPGLALVVVRGGEIALAKAYGYADLEREVHMTAATPVGIGSTVKGMTVLALLQLVSAGAVDLDASVSSHVPELATGFPQAVTVRHALSMSAGLSSWLDHDDLETGVSRGEWGVPHSSHALERRVASLVGTDLLFQPGEGYSYANDGYAIAGRIIEVASGVSYEEFMREHLFTPLALERTGFGNAPGMAQGYLRSANGLAAASAPQAPGYRPAGIDVHSSAADLGRYLVALLKGETPVVSAAALEQMWTPNVRIDDRSHYGLGWYLEEHKGVAVARHGGHAMTSGSAVFLAPQQGLGVAVLANVDDIAVDATGQAVFFMLAGITDSAQRAPSTFTPDRAVWRAYVGGYASPIGALRVHLDGETLAAVFEEHDITFTLEAYSDTDFVTHSQAADVDGADATFRVEEDGTVRLHLAGKELAVKTP